ncbi:MAG: hypothetical protein V4621_02360 [Pseudomonadota bacterium]
MNAVLKDSPPRTPLSIEWQRVSDNTAQLLHLGDDVNLQMLEKAFAHVLMANFTIMCIPAALTDHPAIDALRVREVRALELTGEKSFLTHSMGAVQYNLARTEPLVG